MDTNAIYALLREQTSLTAAVINLGKAVEATRHAKITPEDVPVRADGRIYFQGDDFVAEARLDLSETLDILRRKLTETMERLSTVNAALAAMSALLPA